MCYPIGIQSFARLREGGFKYIDKTGYIARLIDGAGFYFLSRPRRFGKSLLMSTIDAWFSGRSDLFDGLEITRRVQPWVRHEVIHLDFSPQNFSSPAHLDSLFDYILRPYEERYQITSPAASPSLRFGEIILKAAARRNGRGVVILVDEYDQPLLQSLHNEELRNHYRRELHAFYTVIKALSDHIRFAMLTGVTKFGAMTVFSGLNNLQDISLHPDYAGVCGITAREFDCEFREAVHTLAARAGVSDDEMRTRLERKYAGHRFAAGAEPVFNPFSLLNAFSQQRLGNFWAQTGTPAFLAETLSRSDISVAELTSRQHTEEQLAGVDAALTDTVPLFYQTGYLTIAGYDDDEALYSLCYPNEEVKRSLFNTLLPHYSGGDAAGSATAMRLMRADLLAGRIDDFMIRVKTIFSGFPYDAIGIPHLERHYHNLIYTISVLLGLQAKTEHHTSGGRIDMLVETPEYVYIFEFKLDHSAEAAMRQIRRKRYADCYLADRRKVVLIGVNFSSTHRSIDNWITELINPRLQD